MRAAVRVLALASSIILAACSAQPPGAPSTAASAQSSGRQCFLAREVNSFSPGPDGGFVDVKAGATRWFRLELGGGCPNAKWLTRISLQSAGRPWICEGGDAELTGFDPSNAQRCLVIRVRPLTPAEVQQAIQRL